jgi:hypothetical protein
MPAAGVVCSSRSSLIVLALVYYLVSTIVALRKITAGLDEVIAASARSSRRARRSTRSSTTSTRNLDAGVDAARGPARQEGRPGDAVGLSTASTPAPPPRAAQLPGEHGRRQGAADRRGLHEGHADARAARPRGADRRRQPGRPGAAQRRGRQPRRARALPGGRQDAARARCRARRSSAPTRRSVRAARGRRRAAQAARPVRSLRRGSPVQTPAPFEYERATSVEGAIAALERLGPRRASSPAATACCR